MTMTQVLIIGAGPAALILALSLAQNGIAVRIIEKLDKPSDAQRGIGVQARSLEIYKFLGIVDDVLADARSFPGVKQYDRDGSLVSIKPGLDPNTVQLPPDKPFSTGYAIGQERLGRIITKHAGKFNVHVEFSSELVSLEEHEDHVTATVHVKKGDDIDTIDAEFVVGADGGKSTVRRLLGLKFEGTSDEDDVRWVIGDIQMTGSIDKEFWSFYGRPPGDMLSIISTKRAFEEDVYLFFGFGPGIDVDKAVADREYLFEIIRKKTRIPDLHFVDVKTLTTYRPNNFRVVDTFKKGRAFVAGDAAHVHSATGAQGLNSGVMDSFNLAWKMSLVIKGLSPPSLLDTYNEERHPVIKDMLRLTSGLLKQMNDPNRKGGVMDWPTITNQLGVNYRSSSIVVDEFQDAEVETSTVSSAYESDHILRAGARAPEAPHLLELTSSGRILSFFDIFKPYVHTILIFCAGSGAGSNVVAAAEYLGGLPTGSVQLIIIVPKGSAALSNLPGMKFVLRDTEGLASRAYGAVEGEERVVVIRPDGYVGAIVRGAEGLRKYFARIFNA